MKLRALLLASALALPMSVPAAQSLSDDTRDAWNSTKHAASRTGEMVENGAVKTGRFVENGVSKTGKFVERGVSPIGDRLRDMNTPRVTMNEGNIKAPDRIPAGSDLVVRNTGTTGERFEIKGNGLKDKTFLKPGQSRRLDLDLPRGNYNISSSEGGMTSLRVR
jgi:hypothetical protein